MTTTDLINTGKMAHEIYRLIYASEKPKPSITAEPAEKNAKPPTNDVDNANLSTISSLIFG